MNITNTIIYLIGFPGTGKFTISKEIQKLIPAVLVDNHLILNPVFSVIEADGKTKIPDKAWDYTRKIRDIVLDSIRDFAKPQSNFIFTNLLVEGSQVDRELYSEVELLAKARNANLLTVRLHISVEALCERVGSSDRKQRHKMTEADAVRAMVTKNILLMPSAGYFDIDVTNLSSKDAASQIVDELVRRTR